MAVARRPAKSTAPPKSKPAGTTVLKKLQGDAKSLERELDAAQRGCDALKKTLGRVKDDSELQSIQSELQRASRNFQAFANALRKQGDAFKSSLKNIRG